jgi:hypothetical protein
MKYAELYNRQYTQGEIIGAEVPFAALRRLLLRFNVDLTVEQIANRLLLSGRRVPGYQLW